MSQRSKARLEVRKAKTSDIDGISALISRAYPTLPPYTLGELRGQLNHFPEGQFVAIKDDEIVGYCASSLVSEELAFSQHDWEEVSGNGFGTRHNPNGEWLYGYEMCVCPGQRGSRIGKRLYEERRELAEKLGLSGIVFGGRMPGYAYAKRMKKVKNPEDYLKQVSEGKLRDPVLGFQMANGFEPVGVLKRYLPEDKKSRGHAAHMVWRNPYIDPEAAMEDRKSTGVNSVRLATVQLQARAVTDFDHFIRNIEYFVDVAADYRSDFVLFPELFTLSLLSFAEKKLSPMEAIDALSEFTPKLREELTRMAMQYNINIIGGSHPTRADDGDIQNVALVALRDGSLHVQEKIHPTPNERYWWKIKGGDSIDTIQTDCGPIGVLICYDSEFPELARRLVDEGAKIIFVPFCTDSREGYMRVRYCCQARAIENQCYVVMSGNVGNLPDVDNMDIQYAQSCILTPCDLPFARDGIAAEASENVETLTISDVNLDNLNWARSEGTVTNLSDRRYDLYHIEWDKTVGSGKSSGKRARPKYSPVGVHGAGGG